MEINAKFDAWNNIKKDLENSSPVLSNFPEEGEVWMCILGKNIGYEQNGIGQSFSRPLLVIKKFNNQMFWTVALSTKQKDLDFYYNFTDPMDFKVSIILAQLKLSSIKRFGRKLYRLPEEHFRIITEKLKDFMPSL